jgi:pimeloyl-ACP methyl ester carboxylesterase
MPKVKTNRIEMNYQERGSGDPLICITGVTAPGGVWDAHAQAWEKHFRCILGDNRGVGETDKPVGPYTTDMMADDYAGLMDALGIKKARVVGCSLGSVIAQKLALRHPDKVQSAILMCTWARQDRFGLYTWQQLMKCKATMRPEDFMHYVQMLIFTKPWFDNDGCWDSIQQGLKDADLEERWKPYALLHALLKQHGGARTLVAKVPPHLSQAKRIHRAEDAGGQRKNHLRDSRPDTSTLQGRLVRRRLYSSATLIYLSSFTLPAWPV